MSKMFDEIGPAMEYAAGKKPTRFFTVQIINGVEDLVESDLSTALKDLEQPGMNIIASKGQGHRPPEIVIQPK